MGVTVSRKSPSRVCENLNPLVDHSLDLFRRYWERDGGICYRRSGHRGATEHRGVRASDRDLWPHLSDCVLVWGGTMWPACGWPEGKTPGNALELQPGEVRGEVQCWHGAA